MQKDNFYYQEGYKEGLKSGSIKSLEMLIKGLDGISDEDLLARLSKYTSLVNDTTKRKDCTFYLLGYQDGKVRNWQNKANANFDAKKGVKSKSYKLSIELVEAFAKACEKSNTTQAAQLTKMMQEFIDSTN